MVNYKERIENLVRLAENPGTQSEGELAKLKAIELSIKYRIPCKFTRNLKTTNFQPIKPKIPVQGQWMNYLNKMGWELESIKGNNYIFRKSPRPNKVLITIVNGKFQNAEVWSSFTTPHLSYENDNFAAFCNYLKKY